MHSPLVLVSGHAASRWVAEQRRLGSDLRLGQLGGPLDGLIGRGLIVEGQGLQLGEKGKAAFIRILTLSKAVENELAKSLGPEGTADLKALLRQIIEASDRLEISADNFLPHGQE